MCAASSWPQGQGGETEMQTPNQGTAGENKPRLISTQHPEDLPGRETPGARPGCAGHSPRGLAMRRPDAVSLRFSSQVPRRRPTGWCLPEEPSEHKPSLRKAGLRAVDVQPAWRVEPGGGPSGWARGHVETRQ